MKLVKEYINEKFVEDTDPIEDMGIGKITWKTLKPGFVLQVKKYINDIHPINSYIYILEIRGKITDFKRTSSSTSDITRYKRIDIRYIPGTEASSYSATWWEMDVPWLIKHFEIVQRWELKAMNEKFSEDSDPIKDMGIGLYTDRDFTSMRDFNKFILKAIPLLLKTDNIPVFPLSSVFDDGTSNPYFHILDNYIETYLSFNGISAKRNNSRIFAWNSIITLGIEGKIYI